MCVPLKYKITGGGVGGGFALGRLFASIRKNLIEKNYSAPRAVCAVAELFFFSILGAHCCIVAYSTCVLYPLRILHLIKSQTVKVRLYSPKVQGENSFLPSAMCTWMDARTPQRREREKETLQREMMAKLIGMA